MPVRRLAALAAAAALAGLLAGCEKPTPLVTLQSGTAVVHSEAACWARGDAGAVDEAECLARSRERGVGTLRVEPGRPVRIAVDTGVADTGWVVGLNRRVIERRLTSTTERFTVPESELAGGRALLEVRQVEGARLRGVWYFQVLPAE